VEQQHVMKRGLARLELDMDGLCLVDIDGNLLPAGQQVVLVEGVGMADLLPVGAGDEFHAAGQPVGRRKGDPGGRDVGRTQAPIRRILMPGHETGIMGFLDEEAGIPAQDVRPQQVLDRIEDFGMTDHLVDPGEQHVAAMAHLALDRSAAFGLVILELAAKISHFAGAQGIDREVIAAVSIQGDLLLAEQLLHGFLRPFIFATRRYLARA
jgi:hypothetical protein